MSIFFSFGPHCIVTLILTRDCSVCECQTASITRIKHDKYNYARYTTKPINTSRTGNWLDDIRRVC